MNESKERPNEAARELRARIAALRTAMEGGNTSEFEKVASSWIASQSEGVEGSHIPAGDTFGTDGLDWPDTFLTQPALDQHPEQATSDVGLSHSVQRGSFGPSMEMTSGPAGSAKYQASSTHASLFVPTSVVMPAQATAGKTADVDALNCGSDGSLVDDHCSGDSQSARPSWVPEEVVTPRAQEHVEKLAEYAERRGWLLEQAQKHVEWLADQALLKDDAIPEGEEDALFAALPKGPGPRNAERNNGRPSRPLWDDNKWM